MSIIKVSLSTKTPRTLYISQRYKKTVAAQIQYGMLASTRNSSELSDQAYGGWVCGVAVYLRDLSDTGRRYAADSVSVPPQLEACATAGSVQSRLRATRDRVCPSAPLHCVNAFYQPRTDMLVSQNVD